MWWVVLRGPVEWFEQFAKRFAHPDFEVRRISWTEANQEKTGYALATATLDRCSGLDEARVAALAEVRVLSGLARLAWQGIPPVEATLLVGHDRGRLVGRAILSAPAIAILYGRPTDLIEAALFGSDGEDAVIRDEAVRALERKNISFALEIYGREKPNWGSLFKVYELLRNSFQDEGLCRTGLVSQNQIERFRTSANLTSRSGIDARHATRHGDGPRGMTLEEADRMIRGLLAHWLAAQSDG